MRQIFVVYETDAWHSTNHRECAGVFTSKWAAVNAIVKNHRIELDEFFDEDEIEKTSKRVLEVEAKRRLRKELEFAYQTQGYETNYDIEVWNINEWYLTLNSATHIVRNKFKILSNNILPSILPCQKIHLT